MPRVGWPDYAATELALFARELTGRVNTEESDTHIMLSAINLVNCLAWVELPDPRKGAFGPHSNNVSRGQV